MPPRHAFWTILIGDAPTAFRARDADELRPTLERLRERHPDVVMKWFARGRLWNSPAEASEARRAAGGGPPRRPPDWRPGGEHRDPRDRFKGARKKAESKRKRPGEHPDHPGDQATRSKRPFPRPRGRVPGGDTGPASRKPAGPSPSGKPPGSKGWPSGRRPGPKGGGPGSHQGPAGARPGRRPGPPRRRRR